MWKLTVIRKYTKLGSDFEYEDETHFKSKHLDDLVIIIEKINKFGTNGRYEYKLTKEEGEEECSNHTTS